MTMKVRLLESEAELTLVSEVMLQLRDRFDRQSIIEQIRRQSAHGYQLAYVESGGKALCVAGFVISTKLAWGKHLYVDDLVTAEEYRSTGVGQLLIAWLKAYAREQGCEQIHLDSGVQRFAAHRFYLREGFEISSHHFAIKDLTR